MQKDPYRALALLILISLVIKLWVYFRTPVVNSDAFEYINQAKLLYQGRILDAKNCGKNYLSLYHFLIPISYRIFGDWIIAARALSLFFSVICLIPVYLSLLLMFDKKTAFFSSLLFSVNPFLSRLSTDVIKDQMFWFFLCSGIFFAILWLNKEKKIYFILSFLSFLISSFIRIEGLLFALSSPFFLLFLTGKKKWLLVCSIFIFLLSLAFFIRPEIWKLYLSPRLTLLNYFKNFSLKRLLELSPHILGGGILYVFSIPYFLIFLIGIKGLKRHLKRIEFIYLILLSFEAFLLLIIFFGAVCYSRRYLSIFFFPSFFLIAPCIHYLIDKYGKSRNFALFLTLFIIISCFLYNLKLRRKDALIYKKAGEYIASIEKGRPALVLSYDRRIDLYANLKSFYIFCKGYVLTNISIFSLSKDRIVDYLRKYQIKYVFWENEKWRKDIKNLPFLILLKEWKKKGSSRIYRLYKVSL